MQTLSQQLAAEAALRQKSDAAENARAKELRRATERWSWRRSDCRRCRASCTGHARRRGWRARGWPRRGRSHKFERERDAEREEARRERTRRGAGDPAAGRSMPPQQSAGGAAC